MMPFRFLKVFAKKTTTTTTTKTTKKKKKRERTRAPEEAMEEEEHRHHHPRGCDFSCRALFKCREKRGVLQALRKNGELEKSSSFLGRRHKRYKKSQIKVA